MLRFLTFVLLLGSLHPMAALDPHKALAQYSASTWTQQQGLPQDAIHAITQTMDGFLWLGTDEGLARFDGYEFVTFNRERGALRSNSISALAAGTDGSLWIGSRSGLTRYKDSVFRTYTRSEGFIDDLVSTLFVDHAGILWIVAGGNLSRFDGTHFSNFQRERDLPLRAVRDVTESKNHELYVSGNSAVLKLVNGSFETVMGPADLTSDFPSHVKTDKSGNVWLTGARGVIQRKADGSLRRYKRNEGLSDSFGMNTIAEDRGGTIWVGTDWGLARLEGPHFTNLPDTRDAAAVHCIFEDREGNLWVGSDRGLTRYRDDSLTTIGKLQGFPDNGPAALFLDHRGRAWAGYDDGLFMLPDQHSAPTRISADKLFVRHLRETSRGELLVPTRQGLIRIQDGNRTRFIAPDPQGRKTVFDALDDGKGTLWLALPGGLGELKGDHFRIVIPAGPLYQDDSFYVLAATTDGSIWAGTLSDGLWRYRKNEKRLFSAADGLTSSQIRSLYADPDGTLWVGTLGGGLGAFRDEKFTAFRASDGLLSDNIYSITDDGESLWLGTPRGICRVSRKQLADFAQHRTKLLRPTNYGVEDGMLSAQVTDGQHLSNGILWFATSRGIAIYDPRSHNQVLLPPVIQFLDLSMDRRSFLSRSPHLPPGSGRIQIRYTGIHLRSPERVRYSYMLDGLDSDWVNADGLRAVNYDSLDRGHYRFRMKAELFDGPFSESVLEFELEPHYYETTWFRALCVLGLMMMVWSAYKIRERQVHSRFALVLEERARLAREVHDTLAQGFVGIASQLDVVEIRMPADASPARRALDLARRMARHNLTEARRSLMDLRASALPDQDLGVALQSYVERWVASSGLEIRLNVNGDPSGLPEEIAHHVFRIAQEAAANAITHAAPKRINLDLTITTKQLRLVVEDDGQGFEVEDPFTSKHANFGLIGMRERAQRLKGELRLASAPGTGTRIEATVPL